MKRLQLLSFFLLAVFFSGTVIAQEFVSPKKDFEVSVPEKIQKLIPDPLPAGTYTIGSGGYFPTIDSAFNKLGIDGIGGPVTLELIDELYIAPADSFGFRLNGPVAGAGTDSRVTIKPSQNKKVVLEGHGFRVMSFINTQYLTVDGVGLSGSTNLTFHALYNASYTWNDCLVLLNNSDNNIVKNSIFVSEDYLRAGGSIWLSSSSTASPDSNLILNNFIKKGSAMYLSGHSSGSTRPLGNIVRGNLIGSETDSLINWGIQIERCENSIVENNIVQNIKTMNTTSEQIILGINSYSGLGDIIRNNIVHGLRASGSYAWSSVGILLSGGSGNNCMVYNNMVYDIQSSSTGISSRVSGIQIFNHSNPKVYYNSVYLSGKGANKQGSAALYIYAIVSGADIKNNILVNTRDESPYYASAIYDYTSANLASDNNDLYCSQGQTNCLVRIGGITYENLTNWQTTGRDIKSISEMPVFTAQDLHIDWNIPTLIDGHAIPIAGIANDIDNDPREPVTPDIGADEFVVVPVELTSFTATSNGEEVILSWTTATELNNMGFEVQRSPEGKEFFTVGFVKGQGTTTEQQNYCYTDKNPGNGKNFYRLKQVDYSGSYDYSEVIEIEWRAIETYLLEHNYPNPFNPVTTIGYGIKEKSNVKITVFNSIGEEVAVLVNKENEPGYHMVEFNAFNLPSGVYFYQLRAGDFVHTKKMIMMK